MSKKYYEFKNNQIGYNYWRQSGKYDCKLVMQYSSRQQFVKKNGHRLVHLNDPIIANSTYYCIKLVLIPVQTKILNKINELLYI